MKRLSEMAGVMAVRGEPFKSTVPHSKMQVSICGGLIDSPSHLSAEHQSFISRSSSRSRVERAD